MTDFSPFMTRCSEGFGQKVIVIRGLLHSQHDFSALNVKNGIWDHILEKPVRKITVNLKGISADRC